MDEGSTPDPRPATAPPRLGTPEDPVEVHSGRGVLLVLGSMALFFFALTMLAIWGAKNG
jgi:hypothetical protein